MWLSMFATVCAGSYAASTLLPIRGIHDLLVPGTVFRGPGEAIHLSFDDGPDEQRTPAVLDILAAHGAIATFFVIGSKARRHPGLVRRIAAAGHTVGNHTLSHRWLAGISGRAMARELGECQAMLSDILGAAPRFMRPPYGSRDVRLYRRARELQLTPVMWSRDSRDWAGRDADRIVRRCRRAVAGDIVLLHDGSPHAPHTVAALPRALDPEVRYRGLDEVFP